MRKVISAVNFIFQGIQHLYWLYIKALKIKTFSKPRKQQFIVSIITYKNTSTQYTLKTKETWHRYNLWNLPKWESLKYKWVFLFIGSFTKQCIQLLIRILVVIYFLIVISSLVMYVPCQYLLAFTLISIGRTFSILDTIQNWRYNYSIFKKAT